MSEQLSFRLICKDCEVRAHIGPMYGLDNHATCPSCGVELPRGYARRILADCLKYVEWKAFQRDFGNLDPSSLQSGDEPFVEPSPLCLTHFRLDYKLFNITSRLKLPLSFFYSHPIPITLIYPCWHVIPPQF